MFLLPRFYSSFLPLLAALQATPASYTVYGLVRLPDGSLASRVTVFISSQASLSFQVLTNDVGRYEIQGLPRGRYSLTAANLSSPEQFSDPVEIDATRGSPPRIQVNIYLRSGVRIESRNNKDSATIALVEAGQNVPKNAHKAYLRAQTYQSKKQYENALASYGVSLELYPAYFQALAARGHLRIAMGRIAGAAEDFANALELNSRYEPALRGSGLCKFQEGGYADAIKDFERAAIEAPGNYINPLFIGISYCALDRPDAARIALRKALSIDPIGAARAHVHLASLYIKENQPVEAMAEIRAYLSAAPKASDAEKWRSVVKRLQKEGQKD